MFASLQQLDTAALLWIHTAWRSRPADAFFAWITDLGHFVWALAAAWVLLLILGGRSGRWLALGLAVCLLATDQIAGAVLKPMFARTRPCFEIAGVQALVPVAHCPSFPSNHAANVFGIAWLVILERGAGWTWTLFVAGLVAVSRVYLGVHYPSDVIGGALLGVIVAWGVHAGLGAMRCVTESASAQRRTRR